MSTETVTYNVYRVTFSQARQAPDHEGIALVPVQNEDQGAGRFYQVIGSVEAGMTYASKPGYRFASTKSYKSSTLQFRLPRAQLARFEQIASSEPAPHDVRATMEANPDPPVRNCSDWVDDVLAGARTLI
ncbi:hypothetical protein BJX99DRAFT_253272 [Aspergillus californicus]